LTWKNRACLRVLSVRLIQLYGLFCKIYLSDRVPERWPVQKGLGYHTSSNVHNAGALCSTPQTSTYLNVIAPGQRLAFPDPFQSRACPGKSVPPVLTTGAEAMDRLFKVGTSQ
jgi:hypothetical protein